MGTGAATGPVACAPHKAPQLGRGGARPSGRTRGWPVGGQRGAGGRNLRSSGQAAPPRTAGAPLARPTWRRGARAATSLSCVPDPRPLGPSAASGPPRLPQFCPLWFFSPSLWAQPGSCRGPGAQGGKRPAGLRPGSGSGPPGSGPGPGRQGRGGGGGRGEGVTGGERQRHTGGACCPLQKGLGAPGAHLLVDVNGLLVLLQLRGVAGHLQQTLVGRAVGGRAGSSGARSQGHWGGWAAGAEGPPGTCWTPRPCSSLRTARSGRWPGGTREGGAMSWHRGLGHRAPPRLGPRQSPSPQRCRDPIRCPRAQTPEDSRVTGPRERRPGARACLRQPPLPWAGRPRRHAPSRCPPAPSRRSRRWRCGAWPRW